MSKPKLIIVKPSDDKKTIYRNLILYLKQQGIKVVKDSKKIENKTTI